MWWDFMDKEYLNKNSESVKNFLEKQMWDYQLNDVLNMFEFDVIVDGLDSALHYKIEIYQGVMTITASVSMKRNYLINNDISSACELANSINRELKKGSFYIEAEANSVCYKITNSVKNRVFDEEDIKKDIQYCASKIQCYALGFELVDSGLSVSEALNVCRSKLVSAVYRILLRDGSLAV